MAIVFIDKSVQRLRLFNEKAAKLERSRLWEHLTSRGSNYTVHVSGGEQIVEWSGPDDEAIDTFILTLRFFLQDRDGISIREIAHLYDELPVNPALRDWVHEVRNRLKWYLDGNSSLISGNRFLTRRWVLDTVLYGDRAHANTAHRPAFEVWGRHPGLNAMLKDRFLEVAGIVLHAIQALREANEEALASLSRGSS